jgi:ABC-type transport system involved in cytochrome c biogenesis permease subunit
MRILYQLIKGTMAGLVLLAGAWLAFGKRAGIVVIHLGVGLIMASEVFVGLKALEFQMLIGEKDSSNFLMDTGTVELAIINPDHPDHPGEDFVTVIPQSMLVEGETIDDERLPFTIKILEYFENSTQLPPGSRSLATEGIGVSNPFGEIDRFVGTDTDAGVDSPAAYIQLTGRDEANTSLGTWMVGTLLDRPLSVERFPSMGELKQEVTLADGRKFEISLRHARTYVPYEFYLHDVEMETYIGTDTAKSYESLVRVTNREDQFERDNVRIWMNNPLRYAGYTFYQQNFSRDPASGLEATTLQVVNNYGWIVPYLACMIVAVGLTWQFGSTLVRFINRRARMSARETASANGTELPLTRNERRRQERETAKAAPGVAAAFAVAFPWIMGLAAVGYLLVVVNLALVQRPGAREFNTSLFGRLPIVEGGRVQPIDSFARNSLMAVSDVQRFEVHDGEQGESEYRPAVQWLLELMVDSPSFRQAQVLRIDNEDLLADLDLEPRHGLRYAVEEIEQNRLLALQEQMADLENVVVPTPYQRALEDFSRRWVALGSVGERFVRGQQKFNDDTEYLRLLQGALVAYSEGNAGEFNRTVASMHRAAAGVDLPGYNVTAVHFEGFYNGVAPFFCAWILSIAGFVLIAGSWLGWTEPLRRAAEVVMWIALALITAAIIGRIYISGRPPVTNLYSSAVFIAWVIVLFGLVFELIYRNSMGITISAIAGILTLKISHTLAIERDTFTVLQAVLDTQFWLATHVVSITMGYATTYVAGLFGLMYMLSGFAAEMFPQRFTTAQISDLKKNLVRMMYGTLCFALLFSFVGTVLGGLWADDSWGRFWGWDPKENGALIIVLWNALVLHARWDRIVRDRGFAALCVLGNITVSWSWFGTNALGIGLHAYGFMKGTLMWLSVFVVSQLLIAGLALLPDRTQSNTPTAA